MNLKYQILLIVGVLLILIGTFAYFLFHVRNIILQAPPEYIEQTGEINE